MASATRAPAEQGDNALLLDETGHRDNDLGGRCGRRSGTLTGRTDRLPGGSGRPIGRIIRNRRGRRRFGDGERRDRRRFHRPGFGSIAPDPECGGDRRQGRHQEQDNRTSPTRIDPCVAQWLWDPELGETPPGMADSTSANRTHGLRDDRHLVRLALLDVVVDVDVVLVRVLLDVVAVLVRVLLDVFVVLVDVGDVVLVAVASAAVSPRRGIPVWPTPSCIPPPLVAPCVCDMDLVWQSGSVAGPGDDSVDGAGHLADATALKSFTDGRNPATRHRPISAGRTNAGLVRWACPCHGLFRSKRSDSIGHGIPNRCVRNPMASCTFDPNIVDRILINMLDDLYRWH